MNILVNTRTESEPTQRFKNRNIWGKLTVMVCGPLRTCWKSWQSECSRFAKANRKNAEQFIRASFLGMRESSVMRE